MLRHGTPFASRGVPGETGHFSSGIWSLGVFSRRCTGESLPLRVDFTHRVEFEEVSGHRAQALDTVVSAVVASGL